MEIKGKITKILEPVTGTSEKGAWTKQQFIIGFGDKYPKILCIECWGDQADQVDNLTIGDDVTCQIDVTSREYQGKYYTQARAWKVEVSKQQVEDGKIGKLAADKPATGTGAAPAAPVATDGTAPEDDLPF